MPILVTGGTGFIGRYVVRLLVARGETVHMLVREQRSQTESRNLKIFIGDVQDIDSLHRAIRGCDRVVHMAAYARAWARDPTIFYQINVLGTRNVLECAVRSGVSRVICTSSCSAVRIISQGEAQETDFTAPDEFLTEYALSKHLAEQEVVKFGQTGVHTVIVYPTRVYGPGPLNDANGATKALSLYLHNRLPLPDSMLDQVANWAFVEDVALGHVLALERGFPGGRFILGGNNTTLRHVLDLTDQLSGRRHLRFTPPHLLIRVAASLEETRAQLFGLQPLVTRRWLSALSETARFSSRRAVRELGYQIKPLEDGLRHTILWLMNPNQRFPDETPRSL